AADTSALASESGVVDASTYTCAESLPRSSPPTVALAARKHTTTTNTVFLLLFKVTRVFFTCKSCVPTHISSGLKKMLRTENSQHSELSGAVGTHTLN